MMPLFLGFPYIVEETAAHLFGVPHGHEHFASVSKCSVNRGADLLLTAKNNRLQERGWKISSAL